MRVTFSRRALIPCAGFAASAILGSAFVAVPTSAAQAAEAFTRHVSVEAAGFTDVRDVAWEPRTGFDGGTYANPGTFDVAGTSNDKVYQSELWGMTGWHSAVPAAGEYDVTLHMREVWFSKQGQRVFDVSAEGQPAATGIDIVKAVGVRTAYDKTFRVKVTDGRLDLGFKGTADQPQVSGITVAAVTPSTTPTGFASATQSGSTATLSWTAAANPSNGWYVERDGSDSTGYGAWGTTVAGATRTQTFTGLVQGNAYRLTVTNRDTGQKQTVSVTMGAANPSPTPSQSPTTTPTSNPTTAPPTSPAPTATLAATVSTLGTSATITWSSATTPAAGWTVGRDGSDSTGYGAWSTTVDGSARTQAFTRLQPGQTYNLSVKNGDTGAAVTKSVTISSTATFTPSPAPTTGTPSPAPTTSAPAPNPGGTGSATARILGTPRSGKPWFSGAWRGAPFTPAAMDAIGTWRGAPMDAATAYSNKDTLSGIANSQWNVSTFNGFGGILSYNVTPVPYDRSASFASVARGDQDWVWRKNAQILKDNGRGNSLVNIGWEMNGNWWPWSTTAATAEQYKAAFNRIASVMRGVAPGLRFGFIINCNTPLAGGSNRLDALTKLYPGDAYTDVVGCNSYDWWSDKARNEGEWAARIRPSGAPGLADVAEFARAKGKGLALPEWGPAATSVQGSGDNPFFIQKMFDWFMANKDVLVLENYFMEEGPGVANSLFNPVQMPLASAKYRSLW